MSNRRTEFVIVRSDGHFYLGTADKNPLFGHGENAATFPSREAANQRCLGLEEGDPEHDFEVEPA